MGKPYIDFGKIREQISLEEVLRLIGYTFLVKTKWRCYGRCPLHCCAASRAASFYLPKNLWFCHRCKQGGNQLDLYLRVRNMNEYDAVLDLLRRSESETAADGQSATADGELLLESTGKGGRRERQREACQKPA